jgi:hypothetical protein
MIGVMVELPDTSAAVRHFYAVAKPDQARAEWAAVDCATALGRVATSPVGGEEPVKAMAPLPASTLRQFGVADGTVKALGWRWPRRWLPPA